MIDYTIVVPSRKRSHNMQTIRALLPSAIVCVDEREAADYREFVPESNLLLHPPMEGSPAVFNWMFDEIKSEVLVEVDCDFKGVQCMVGSNRYITDADEIRSIIENSAIVCKDLGLTTFCWSRSPNSLIVAPNERPMRPVQPVCAAFGIMGSARNRKYDPELYGRADVDFTLQTLHEDRLVYADCRFYFDVGPVYTGRGGNVGLITGKQFEKATRELKTRWGKAISFKVPGYARKQARSVAAMHIAVSRTNKLAQK